MFLLIQNYVINLKKILDYFTFHDVSINTEPVRLPVHERLYFTFHDVSINTSTSRSVRLYKCSLHSTMFLLIQKRPIISGLHTKTLHSTMFLLILDFPIPCEPYNTFTFHDVSINTISWMRCWTSNSSLHSTMFLLIRYFKRRIQEIEAIFTFHDVSINTAMKLLDISGQRSLHSTMFLLIRNAN